jgi:hypothetical protein
MTLSTGVDLWDEAANWRCITTNGSLRQDKSAVMGRGCALEAKTKFPHLPTQLGKHLIARGNVIGFFPEYQIITFPVKHNWHEPADLDLIEFSTRQLEAFARVHMAERILLPMPGCGNGRRRWEEVRPLLVDLPDNVVIIAKEKVAWQT